MRLTIIKDDNFVSIDGVGVFGVDLSQLGNEINAVQWDGVKGHIEIRDLDTKKIISNIEIDSIDEYEFAIVNYHAKLEEISSQTQQNYVENVSQVNNNVITTVFEE